MAGKSVSIATEHRDEIIQRMSQGEALTAIATSLGYASHSGIVERLGDDPDYQKALRSGLIGKIEKREKELEGADENVTVTRADRLLAHARWMAERLDSERFGNKQLNVNVNFQAISIQAALDEAHGRLIEAERSIDAAPQQEVETLDLDQEQQEAKR